MSVPKHKRKESKFQVFRHLYVIRKEIMNELLFDFGFRIDKAEKRLLHKIGRADSTYEELDEKEKAHYDILKERFEKYNTWFIKIMRNEIFRNLQDITREVFMANMIYPTIYEELIERRIHQDRALGYCAELEQNLFFVIIELPVDHNKYTRLAYDIREQEELIKRWRQSDGRFRKLFNLENSSENIEKPKIISIDERFSKIDKFITQSTGDPTLKHDRLNINYNTEKSLEKAYEDQQINNISA